MRTDFGGGSLQSKVVGLALRHSVKRVIYAWSLAPGLPWPYFVVDQAGRFQKKVPGTTIEEVALPHCRADVFRTPASDTERVIVYFHGGAFLVGGRHLHRALISRIADATRSTVISVDYRQLPKHSVGTSIADCLDGYRYALELGNDPADIVFMGDSAGGYLTFVTADLAASEGLPSPAGIVAMSPLVDFDFERTPIENGRLGCDVFPYRFKLPFLRLVLKAEGGVHPHAPAAVSPTVLPPVLIQGSSTESLYAHLVAMHDLLETAGHDVQLQIWDQQVHVFQAGRLLPEAQQAVGEIAMYVERVAPAVRRKTA